MIEPGKVYRTLAEEIQRAVIRERERCAEIAQMAPLEGFTYDTRSHSDILRWRDMISELIRGKYLPGERLR